MHIYSIYDLGDDNFVPSSSFYTPLTHIKAWSLFVYSEILGSFDLSGAEELQFYCMDSGNDLTIGSIPSQLMSLTLNGLELELDSCAMLVYGPQLMPHLLQLRLVESSFEGRLQDYLKCPKLKNLYLDQVNFYTITETGAIEDDTTPIDMPLSSSLSLSSIPELELLSIRRGVLDGEITTALQSCSLLHHLSANWCVIREFIPSFTSAIVDDKNFASLQSLCLVDCLCAEDLRSQKEFVRYCVSQRPGLTVRSDNLGLSPTDYLSTLAR
jgi:hypothetical protein